jgi:cytoskeletal protein CcmA (bactofilin family)
MGSNESETVVGPLTRIAGEISGGEDLVVLGHVAGKILLPHTVTVADGGIVEAELEVRHLIVSGVLVGVVRASDSVHLTPRARVVGDIITPRLIVEAGAAFRGRVDMGDGDAWKPTGPGPRPTRPVPPLRPSTPKWPESRLPAALTGSLDQVGIDSVLTVLEMERRTGVLELRSQGHRGRLALREGFVVSANIDDATVTGCDAVCHTLRWNGGHFAFRLGDVGVEDEVAVPTALLLLEAARRTDESLRGSGLSRSPAGADFADQTPALAGVLEHIGITSALTLLEMERREGVLELRSRRRVASLALRAGCVVSTVLDGTPVPVCDAVIQLLRWDRGRFSFRANEVEGEEGLAVPTTRLLLEAGRRADASAAA